MTPDLPPKSSIPPATDCPLLSMPHLMRPPSAPASAGVEKRVAIQKRSDNLSRSGHLWLAGAGDRPSKFSNQRGTTPLIHAACHCAVLRRAVSGHSYPGRGEFADSMALLLAVPADEPQTNYGRKVGPLSMVDLYGTPYCEKLRATERYRRIDGAAARDAQLKIESRYLPAGISSPLTNEFGRWSIDPDTSKPGLQVEVTVEDPVMFTTPWTGFISYRHVFGEWPEAVCAENAAEYYASGNTLIPVAEIPDF